MRKFTSLLLTLCLLAAFTGCSRSRKSDGSDMITPANYTQDFTDSSGKTVYRIDITYPQLTEKAGKEAISNMISFGQEFVDYYIHMAEANIENASRFMNDNNSDSPWLRKVYYDFYYIDPDVISFVINTEFSAIGGDVTPTYEGCTVSLHTGKQLTVSNLATDEPEATKEAVMQAIHTTANKTYSPNGIALEGPQLALLDSLYLEKDFCLSDTFITFIYNFKELSGGSRSGCYYCEVPLESLSSYISTSEIK